MRSRFVRALTTMVVRFVMVLLMGSAGVLLCLNAGAWFPIPRAASAMAVPPYAMMNGTTHASEIAMGELEGARWAESVLLQATTLPPTATPEPPPTVTPEPPPTATPTPTVTGTLSSTPTPTDTPTPTNTPTDTATPTATSTPTDTATPTNTPTPTNTATHTPTSTGTPQPIEICYDSDPRQAVIYRIDASLFRGYLGDVATSNHLIEVTSPPAPVGWNQPAFVPDASWRPAAAVWWEGWRAQGWGPLISGASILGLTDAQGNPEMADGVTHLIRQTFHLIPPEPGMRILSVSLEMWSDNKSAWWWQGERVMVDREGYGGLIELAAERFDPEGGTYVLAVQNSNDFHVALNPQGTAFRLCVVWTYPNSP